MMKLSRVLLRSALCRIDFKTSAISSLPNSSQYISRCLGEQNSTRAIQANLHQCRIIRNYGNETNAEKSAESTSDEKNPAASEENDPDAELREEIVKLKEANEDLMDKYRRSLANFDNLQKRSTRDVNNAKLYGIQSFCKDLLEIPDILDRAVTTVPEESLSKSQELKDLFVGLQMTQTVVAKIFQKHGLKRVDPAIGEKFDPEIHEALFQIPDPDKEPGTIGNVVEIGYSLHDRPIRPAKVGVIKKT